MPVLLSTGAHDSVGFTRKGKAQARDLRGAVFGLLTDDFEAFRSDFEALFPKLAGVVISLGEGIASQKLGDELFHWTVTQAALPSLSDLVLPWLSSIERARTEQRNAQRLVLELNRAKSDLARVEVAHHNADRQVHIVLENAGDALVLADREGKLDPTASSLAYQWFGSPKGKVLWDYVLTEDDPLRVAMRLDFEQVRDGFLPEDLVLGQLPKSFNRGERTYRLSPRPIVDQGELRQILFVITDITEVLAHERAEREARETHALFMAIMEDRQGFLRAIGECREILDALASRPGPVVGKRLIHTLKGTSAILGLFRVAELCHTLEDELSMDPDNPSFFEAAYTRIHAVWSSIEAIAARLVPDAGETPIELTEEEYTSFLRRLSEGPTPPFLIERARAFRLSSADRVLRTVAKGVEGISKRLAKKVYVEIEARGVRFDADRLSDVLTNLSHVLRNAVDHGLEPPEERVLRGKPEAGSIRLGACIQGEVLEISVGDDGAGIDWDRVREKAKVAGIPHGTQEELVACLFADGLSTRDTVNELSGRGIGLAAVKHAVDRQRGSIAVESVRGCGTVMRFSFPLRASDNGIIARLSLSNPPSGIHLIPGAMLASAE